MTINFSYFSWFWPNVPVFGMFPSSSWNELDTILKYIKNDYDPCRVWLIWWRLALDNLDQKGSNSARWRNPLWPLWRPPVTWRRVLRTMIINFSWFFMIFRKRARVSTWGTPSWRGRGCEALSSTWCRWYNLVKSSKNDDFWKSLGISLDHQTAFLLLPNDS